MELTMQLISRKLTLWPFMGAHMHLIPATLIQWVEFQLEVVQKMLPPLGPSLHRNTSCALPSPSMMWIRPTFVFFRWNRFVPWWIPLNSDFYGYGHHPPQFFFARKWPPAQRLCGFLWDKNWTKFQQDGYISNGDLFAVSRSWKYLGSIFSDW